MGQVPRVATSGGLEPDTLAISKQLDEVVQVVDSQVEFGEPQDPSDPASTTLAGVGFETPAAGAHNGTISNIHGSWVEVALTSTGITDYPCHHNLYIHNPQYVVPVTGQPNCRWLVFGVMHDGTNLDGTSTLSVDVSFVGGTVDKNDTMLRFNVTAGGTALTIDGTHPVLVTLFFTQATRGE